MAKMHAQMPGNLTLIGSMLYTEVPTLEISV